MKFGMLVVGGTLALRLACGQPIPAHCQANIAVGAFPAREIVAVVDNGGTVEIEKLGAVYQLTVRDWVLNEDRWPDLRDYEIECR